MGEAKRRHHSGSAAVRKPASKRSLALGVMTLMVVAMLIGLFFIMSGPSPDSNELPVAKQGTPDFPAELDKFGVSVGAADAPVVVREFADYQCPACARFADASQRLKKEYVESGKVRFVYFELPLSQHANAMAAAEAARWAGVSDPQATFTRYAGDLGLSENRFSRCMATELHREAIEQSAKVATQLRVVSTPTVMVDNIVLTRPGWGQLSAVVERELAISR
jgi:protein-disulfide isomerase